MDTHIKDGLKMMELILFLFAWIGVLVFVLDTMSRDNMHWMTSSPEWSEKFKGQGPVVDYSWKEYLKYVLFFRVKTVWTDGRDIIPGLISAIGLTFMIFDQWLLGISIIIMHWIFGLLYFKERGRQRTWQKQ